MKKMIEVISMQKKSSPILVEKKLYSRTWEITLFRSPSMNLKCE